MRRVSPTKSSVIIIDIMLYIALIITVILVCRGRRLRWRPPLDRSIQTAIYRQTAS